MGGSSIFLYLITAVFAAVPAAVIAFVVILMIKKKKKSASETERPKDSNRVKYNIISAACIFIAALSYWFNMGWARFAMLFFAIPILHAVAMFLINNFAAPIMGKSKSLKILAALSYVTYLCANFFLSDGDDVSRYALFHLVECGVPSGNQQAQNLIFICDNIAAVAIVANVIILILELTEIIIIRERAKGKSE